MSRNLLIRKLHPSSVVTGTVQFGSFSWVGKDLSPLSMSASPQHHIWLSVEFGEFCPLNCLHCGWKKQISRDPMSLSQLLEVLEEFFKSEYKPELLSISGKEPSVTKKETLAISEIAKKYHIPVIMMTSGIGFTRTFVEETKGLIDFLDLSIDGDERYHDLIRGPGMFQRAVRALEMGLKYGDFASIGIITTANHKNINGIHPLINYLKERFQGVSKIRHTIGMYHGLPEDDLLLTLEDILKIFQILASINNPPGGHENKVLWLYYANYAYLLQDLFNNYGLSLNDAQICKRSGLYVLDFPNFQLALLNHNRDILLIPRISTDGYLFLTCSHLIIEEPSAKYSIGDVLKEPVSKILKRFYISLKGLYYDFGPLSTPPEACLLCDRYPVCGGGDRLLGLFINNEANDPFCPFLKHAGMEVEV